MTISRLNQEGLKVTGLHSVVEPRPHDNKPGCELSLLFLN